MTAENLCGAHRAPLQKFRLRAGWRFQPELAIGVRGRDAALSRAFDVTFHDQIRLVHFFDRPGLFAVRGVPRVRAAISAAPAESISTPSNRALRRMIFCISSA